MMTALVQEKFIYTFSFVRTILSEHKQGSDLTKIQEQGKNNPRLTSAWKNVFYS